MVLGRHPRKMCRILRAFLCFYALFISMCFLTIGGPDCYPRNVLESFLHFIAYLTILRELCLGYHPGHFLQLFTHIGVFYRLFTIICLATLGSEYLPQKICSDPFGILRYFIGYLTLFSGNGLVVSALHFLDSYLHFSDF